MPPGTRNPCPRTGTSTLHEPTQDLSDAAFVVAAAAGDHPGDRARLRDAVATFRPAAGDRRDGGRHSARADRVWRVAAGLPRAIVREGIAAGLVGVVDTWAGAVHVHRRRRVARARWRACATEVRRHGRRAQRAAADGPGTGDRAL